MVVSENSRRRLLVFDGVARRRENREMDRDEGGEGDDGGGGYRPSVLLISQFGTEWCGGAGFRIFDSC